MEGWDKVASAIDAVLEMICVVVIAGELSGRITQRKHVFRIVLGLLMFGCSLAENFIFQYRWMNIINYVLVIVMIDYEYAMSLQESVKFTIFSIIMVALLELMTYCGMYAFTVVLPKDILDLTMAVTLLIVIIAQRKGWFYVGKQFQGNWNRRVTVFFVGVVFILTYFVCKVKVSDGVMLQDILLLIFILLVFYGVIYSVCMMEAEKKLHKQYEERYAEIITEIRTRQHKFMNQLNSIVLLSEVYDTYEELVAAQREETQSLQGYMLPNKILILERPLVIAHIYNKLCEAEEKNIQMNLDISCSLQDVTMPDIYLIEILGNLIDNAMDEIAARKCDEKLYLAVRAVGSEVCISVENEHEKIPYSVYHNFFTEGYSSKGKNRGLGLPYVKKIVNKYGGRLEVGNMEKEQNVFSIRVYLKS